MFRLVKNLALVSALILGGVAAGCQPEQKECHCSGPNCSCPLAPVAKPATPGTDQGKSSGEQVADSRAKHHHLHAAHRSARHTRLTRTAGYRHEHGTLHERERNRTAANGHHEKSSHTGSRAHRTAWREAAERHVQSAHASSHNHAAARREAAEYRNRSFHAASQAHMNDRREAAGRHARWAEAVRGQAHKTTRGKDRWTTGHYTDRARLQHPGSREAQGPWIWHGRSSTYRPLPYNYHSRSHHYASTEEWSPKQRAGWEAAPYRSGHRSYSGREDARRDREQRYEEESQGAESDSGGEYEDTPDYGESSPAFSGGAAGHLQMSIKAPEALDSWHGYGIDCPDWAEE